MSKTAFLFPGQGSQYVGMAKDVYESSNVAKDLVKNAEEAIGVELSKIMFEGPMESLKQTDITQPAIFLHSILLNSQIKNVQVNATAGHSLGEYSALVAAGAIQFIDAIKLVRTRGQLMLQAGIDEPGTMAAVIGMEAEVIEKVCNEVSKEHVVQCANFNSPGQIVISGSVEGVKIGMEKAKEAGAKLVKELVVSGAFHSPLMESAKNKYKESLDSVNVIDAKIPVYANVTSKAVTNKDEIKNLLFEQLTSPVMMGRNNCKYDK